MALETVFTDVLRYLVPEPLVPYAAIGITTWFVYEVFGKVLDLTKEIVKKK